MRLILVLVPVCGIVLLTSCSPPDQPAAAVPDAATPVPAAPSPEATAEPAPEETAAEPVMEGNTGLAAGQKAPAFQLKDQTGTDRSLDEYLAQGKVALVFYRSADW